ncbi:MAG: hypothetical protein AAF492_24435, partial [Verrucomicrobiota bacterium]
AESDHEKWVLAYDAKLLRKMWIRIVPPGTRPVASELRNIGRPGRLRWVTGRRSEEENWDAYEALNGAPLSSLITTPQPWSSVRFWLHDLAEECAAFERDRTRPVVLALDRVWISAEGRAKLLDFPPPGHTEQPGRRSAESGIDFLSEVAARALEGLTDRPETKDISAPVPVHARSFLEKLPDVPDAATAAATLKELLYKPATVSRRRRAAMVACSLALPIGLGIFVTAGTKILAQWNEAQPEVFELNQVLSVRDIMRTPSADPNGHGPDDRLFSIYIADRLRDSLAGPEQWNTLFARSLLKPAQIKFIQQSMNDHPSPSEEDVTQAHEAISPFLGGVDISMMTTPWLPLIVTGSCLIFYVALPALIAALIFRGGLIMIALGVAVVRTDGLYPSHFRVLWRSFLSWSPLLVITPAGLGFLIPWAGGIIAGVVISVVLIGLTVCSLVLPDRG